MDIAIYSPFLNSEFMIESTKYAVPTITVDLFILWTLLKCIAYTCNRFNIFKIADPLSF